jgi:outer membrane protein assembly factor BamB
VKTFLSKVLDPGAPDALNETLKLMRGFLLLSLIGSSACAANWPGWRGPHGNGITEETNLPAKWTTNENVKWRIALPEPGNSTPIVWDQRIFLTQPIGDRRTIRCLSRAKGELLWEQGVTTKAKEPTHSTNPYCSASPVTDGERVIASFASDGVFCYDLAGKELWRRTDLGRQIHIWGGGASPAIYGDFCFLNFGPGDTTYLIAFEKKTGRTVWKHVEETGYGHSDKTPAPDGAKKNPTYVGSWTTPIIVDFHGQAQVLMSWPGRLAAYVPADGKEIWTCSGLNPLVYTSPIYAEDLIIAMGGFGGRAIAVRNGGNGDVTSSRLVWQPSSFSATNRFRCGPSRSYLHP